MNYRLLISAGGVLVSTVALSLSYSFEQYWAGSVAALGLGLCGLLCMKKRQSIWIRDTFLVGAVLLVSIGNFLNLNIYLLLLAIIGTVGTWDIIRFYARIEHSILSESIHIIEKQHLKLLGIALLCGSIFGYSILTFRMQLSFGFSLVLGILLIFSLGGIARLLRN